MWEYLYLLVGISFYFLYFFERTSTYFFIKFVLFLTIIFAWPYYLIGLIINKNIEENKNHKKDEPKTMKKFAIKIGENLYSNYHRQPYGSNIKPSPITAVDGLRKAKLFESEELANDYWMRNKKYMNIGNTQVMIVEYKIKNHE